MCHVRILYMCFRLGCGCPYPCWELTSNSRCLKLEIQMSGSHSTVHRPGRPCCSPDTSLPLHPRSLLLAGWWLIFVPKHRLLFYKLLESRAFFFFFHSHNVVSQLGLRQALPGLRCAECGAGRAHSHDTPRATVLVGHSSGATAVVGKLQAVGGGLE